MSVHHLCTRVQRLERRTAEHEAAILHVWRLLDESAEEAFTRCEVDPEDSPQVHVHVWPEERVSPRLGPPPAPLWVSRTLLALADLEHGLHEGMRQLQPQRPSTQGRLPS